MAERGVKAIAILLWVLRPKEIIAEDYRVLFSPKPYNGNHRRVVDCGYDTILLLPSQEVGNYIENLNTLLTDT